MIKGKSQDDSYPLFQFQEQSIQIGAEKQKVLRGVSIEKKMEQMGLNVWSTVLTGT